MEFRFCPHCGATRLRLVLEEDNYACRTCNQVYLVKHLGIANPAQEGTYHFESMDHMLAYLFVENESDKSDMKGGA